MEASHVEPERCDPVIRIGFLTSRVLTTTISPFLPNNAEHSSELDHYLSSESQSLRHTIGYLPPLCPRACFFLRGEEMDES
jgi:hypothetical protein